MDPWEHVDPPAQMGSNFLLLISKTNGMKGKKGKLPQSARTSESHNQDAGTTRPTTLFAAVSATCRLRMLSRQTEKHYLLWIRRFIRYHHRRHPRTMGEQEIEQFLTFIAVKKNVAPSTQNQALNALVFLFRHVLNMELGKFKNIRWAKRKPRPPEVLTREEVARVLSQFKKGTPQKLIAHLLYGCGLRLTEALNLRIKDIDFGQSMIFVRDAKGGKDRTVPLPRMLVRPLAFQIDRAKKIHQMDLAAGFGKASLPFALVRKYPKAGISPLWQYVFPSYKRSVDPRSGETKRHHLYDSILENSVARAVRSAGVEKRVTCHTFRHSYATHLLESGNDIRKIQVLLGHSDVKTTMIYTHVAKGPAQQCESPLDTLIFDNQAVSPLPSSHSPSFTVSEIKGQTENSQASKATQHSNANETDAREVCLSTGPSDAAHDRMGKPSRMHHYLNTWRKTASALQGLFRLLYNATRSG